MKFIEALKRMRKAIVAAIAVVVIKTAHNLGVEIDQETIAVIVDTLLVSLAVWAVPNTQPYLVKEGY